MRSPEGSSLACADDCSELSCGVTSAASFSELSSLDFASCDSADSSLVCDCPSDVPSEVEGNVFFESAGIVQISCRLEERSSVEEEAAGFFASCAVQTLER